MIGYYSLVFTNSQGDSISFGATKPYVLQSIQGLDTPSTDIQTKRAPFQDGTTFTDALLMSRDIIIDVHVLAGTDSLIYTYRDELFKIFSPKFGEGTLTIGYEGIERSIKCVPDRVIAPNSTRTCGYQKAMIILFASNPTIQDSEFTTVVLAAFTGGFTLPFSFPISFGTVGQDVIIDNTGHVDVPILITMTGPLEDPVFTNNTTGFKIELTGAGGLTLLAGETLTINTNLATPTIIIDDGVTESNAYKYLSSDSVLWQLVLGENELSYVAAAQGGAATVQVQYKNGYLGV